MESQKTETVSAENSDAASLAAEVLDRSIISMERLHEIVNGGNLTALSTEGVVDSAQIGDGCPSGSYTCWILQYQSGYRCSLYTLNQEAAL